MNKNILLPTEFFLIMRWRELLIYSANCTLKIHVLFTLLHAAKLKVSSAAL